MSSIWWGTGRKPVAHRQGYAKNLIPQFVCTNSLRLRPPSAIGPYRTRATQKSRGAPKNATEKGHRSSPCIKGACHIISRSATTASLIPRLIGGYAGKLQTARGPSRQMNSRYGGVSGEERPKDQNEVTATMTGKIRDWIICFDWLHAIDFSCT